MKDRDVTWDFSDAEKSSLYPVPRGLFRTEPLSDKDWRESGVGFDDAESEGGEVSLATRYSRKREAVSKAYTAGSSQPVTAADYD